MKHASLLVLALSGSTLAACEGLSQAFTAHVDVAAKAGSQELSVVRLGDLIGKSKIGLPVNREVATLVARDLWIPYQLLGLAAGRNDSLNDPKAIDSATAAMLENTRLQRFMEQVATKMPVDSGSETAYTSGAGDLYSARHILFKFPDNATPAAKDSVRKAAAAVRPQVTDANFADMAKKYSKDASAQSGRLMQQIQSAPDSLVGIYATNMAQRDVLLRRADSAKVVVKPEEINQLHTDFAQAVAQSWTALGVDPKSLVDSAKTPDARERLAAARVEAYMDRVMNGQAQPLPIPVPLVIVLLNKYEAKVNAAGIDPPVELGTQLRAQADSSRTAGQPKSAVA